MSGDDDEKMLCIKCDGEFFNILEQDPAFIVAECQKCGHDNVFEAEAGVE